MKKKENEPQAKPSLQEEVASLKRSVASYKSSNTTLKAKLDACKEEAQEEVKYLHAQIDELKAALCAKDKAIEGLESQVNTLKETIAEREGKIKELNGDFYVANTQVEYYKSLPWYKRIFFKG